MVRIIEISSDSYKNLGKGIVDGIVNVAIDAFGPGMSRGEVLDHILPTDRLYVTLNFMGGVEGFATATFKRDSVDLVGAAVRKSSQGKGLYSDFSERRINLALHEGYDKVTLRTQNPKVELGMRGTLERLVQAGVISSYDSKRKIIHGMYGRMLTKEKPFTGFGIDKLYEDLDYDKGDTFSFEFQLKK